jgi:hypothetical protein
MKKMKLRAFLRVAHFSVVEKDGTVWVERNGIWMPQKAKKPARMLALHGKERDDT